MDKALDVNGVPLDGGLIVRSVTDNSSKCVYGMLRGEVLDGFSTEYNRKDQCQERIVEVKILETTNTHFANGETIWAIDHHLEIIHTPPLELDNSLVEIFDSYMGGD